MRANRQSSSARSASAQFKRGVVEKVDDKDPSRMRVKFQDEDGVESFWLSVGATGAKGNRHAASHRVGEQVACLVDWRGEDGVILGGLYSEEDKRPEAAAESHHVEFEDGAIHEHDPMTKTHRIALKEGTLQLSVGEGRVHVTQDKMILQVGGTRLMIGAGGIVSSAPITVGAVPAAPDIKTRKK